LHTALAHVAPPPYLLVRHSWGGPLVRAFSGLFPKDVAGLVLVDPTDFGETVEDSDQSDSLAIRERCTDAKPTTESSFLCHAKGFGLAKGLVPMGMFLAFDLLLFGAFARKLGYMTAPFPKPIPSLTREHEPVSVGSVKGMLDAGYRYVNIDDTWEGKRDAQGRVQRNEKFPDMKALAEYVHSKWLRLGIYS